VGRYLDIAKTAGKPAPAQTAAPAGPSLGLAHPPALVAIDARPDRLAEVRAAYREAMTRLSSLYPSGLASAWDRIAVWPEWVQDIEIAEVAADREALAYQRGATSKPFAFLAALGIWEQTWVDALAATVREPDACQECGRTDALVMVTTATGRHCRRCLRDDGQAILRRDAP
jgi:hypothetical protein